MHDALCALEGLLAEGEGSEGGEGRSAAQGDHGGVVPQGHQDQHHHHQQQLWLDLWKPLCRADLLEAKQALRHNASSREAGLLAHTIFQALSALQQPLVLQAASAACCGHVERVLRARELVCHGLMVLHGL